MYDVWFVYRELEMSTRSPCVQQGSVNYCAAQTPHIEENAIAERDTSVIYSG